MRTTVTLTADADALVRKMMRERGLSFKQAVNAAIVEGLAPRGDRDTYNTPTFDLGASRVMVDRAVQIAAQLEDDELLRKRSIGK